MVVIRHIGTAFLLLILTLWFECGGIAALTAWLRRAVAGGLQLLGPFQASKLVVRLTMALIALHGLQVLLWACCYRWLCFPTWECAIYFSASSYATVGYSDVVLPSAWHMLGPLESIIGVLMCGLSVSLLFAIATRLLGRER